MKIDENKLALAANLSSEESVKTVKGRSVAQEDAHFEGFLKGARWFKEEVARGSNDFVTFVTNQASVEMISPNDNIGSIKENVLVLINASLPSKAIGDLKFMVSTCLHLRITVELF